MKNLLAGILLFLVTIPTLAQAKKIEQISETTYKVKVYDSDGNVEQRGMYIMVDGNFKAHGIWVDSIGSKALYNSGKLVWIEPKGQKRYTSTEIQLNRLKNRVVYLEQKLSSL